MVQIMKQTSTTKTNLEKADACAKKLSDSQDGTSHRTSLSSFQWKDRFLLQGGLSLGARSSLLSSYQHNPDSWECLENHFIFRLIVNHYTNRIFWNCDKHQLKNKHPDFWRMHEFEKFQYSFLYSDQVQNLGLLLLDPFSNECEKTTWLHQVNYAQYPKYIQVTRIGFCSTLWSVSYFTLKKLNKNIKETPFVIE